MLRGSIRGLQSKGASINHKVCPWLVLFLLMSSGWVEAEDVGAPLLTSPTQRQQRPLPDNLNNPDAYSIEHIRERTQQRQQAYQKSTQATRPQALRDDIPILSDAPSSSQAGTSVAPSTDVVQQAGRTLLAAKHSEHHQPVTETLLENERQARQLIGKLKEVDSGDTSISSAPSAQQEPVKHLENTTQTQSLMTLGETMRQRKKEASMLQKERSESQRSPHPDTSLLEQAFQDSVIQRHHYLGQKMEKVGKLEGEARYKVMSVLDAQLSQPDTTRRRIKMSSPTLRITAAHRPVKIATVEK